jgi:hypothetical protein
MPGAAGAAPAPRQAAPGVDPAARSAGAGEAPSPPRSRTRAALGRLRLVKRRLGGQREAGDRRSWVARLLTSF